jgi:hypothetical protein
MSDQLNDFSLFTNIIPVCEQDITPPISTATTISSLVPSLRHEGRGDRGGMRLRREARAGRGKTQEEPEDQGRVHHNGWHVSDVQMTLTAADNIGGSCIKEIHYTVDGTETVVQGSSVSFSIVSDGNHAVTYYAIDNAGNVETPPHVMSINIDKRPGPRSDERLRGRHHHDQGHHDRDDQHDRDHHDKDDHHDRDHHDKDDRHDRDHHNQAHR